MTYERLPFRPPTALEQQKEFAAVLRYLLVHSGAATNSDLYEQVVWIIVRTNQWPTITEAPRRYAMGRASEIQRKLEELNVVRLSLSNQSNRYVPKPTEQQTKRGIAILLLEGAIAHDWEIETLPPTKGATNVRTKPND